MRVCREKGSRASALLATDPSARAWCAPSHVTASAARSRLPANDRASEIRDLLASSDVFVLPTVRESFGIAALEARCAGLPVVAMRASGVAGLIEHGLDGLLAESDVELVSHVARLVCDSELRAAISDHNRRTSPPFDWPRTLDAHLAIYREAIALRDSAWADMNR